MLFGEYLDWIFDLSWTNNIRLYTAPGGAATGAGDVEVGEAQSSGRQPVQVWSERARVSIAAQIPEAQIISEKKNKVRRCG